MPKFNPTFKNSLKVSFLGLLLSGVVLGFYLRSQPQVPAWIPPPLCPCWNSITFSCDPKAVCLGLVNPVIPTPTPYQAVNPNETPRGNIANISFTYNCRIGITTSAGQNFTLPVFAPGPFNPESCNSSPTKKISASGKYAAFIDTNTPQKPALKVYFLSLHKIFTLEVVSSGLIQDLIFLPNDHIVALINNQLLKTYDVPSLSSTYPNNIDFSTNIFKSIIVQSDTTRLDSVPDVYQNLAYTDGIVYVLGSKSQILNSISQDLLLPRSSCTCWDTNLSACLPQSSCVGQ